MGLLSTARITNTLLRSAGRVDGRLAVTHVASRDQASADEFAARWRIPFALEGYDRLIDSPEVDAIYVSLPASMHGEWALRSLEAGKHVLCEKPFCANGNEAREMVAAGRRSGRVLMEAMHYRYHPLVQRAFDVVAEELGPLYFIEAGFWHPVPSPSNIRRDYTLGGGATMDFGCYALHWLRMIAGEPVIRSATADATGEGVDVRMEAELDFPAGVRGRITLSMKPTAPDRYWLHVEGESGTLDADSFIAPSKLRVRTSTGERIETAPDSPIGFQIQLEHFCDCIAAGTEPLTGGADSIANMVAIDAVYEAAGLPRRQPLAELLGSSRRDATPRQGR